MLTVGDGGSSSAIMRQSFAAQMPPPKPQARPPGLPHSDGTFSSSLAGTQPKPELDLQFAQMSNDSYVLPGSRGDGEKQSIQALEAAGWNRLEPVGDHMVDANGNTIAIDPSLLENEGSGFRAAIYQNQDGQYVVAYAGTDPGQMADIGADATQAFGLDTAQYSQATQLARQAERVFGDGNVAFTGHSLGGGLAAAASLATNASGVTFNAAGLSNDTIRALGFSPNAVREQAADSGQIRRYVVDGEPLTLAQQDIPIIPILGMSPPNAVGHELRIDPPAGVTGLVAKHGGGGDNTSYVAALQQNSAREPVDLSGTRAGLALGTLENFGEFNLNSLGNGIDAGIGLYHDGRAVVSEQSSTIAQAIHNDIAGGDYVEGGFNIAGAIVDGGFDLAGDVTSGLLDLAGDQVQNLTDFGGNVIRDIGSFTGLQTPANAVAGFVEGTGDVINDVADAGADAADWVGDKLGDGAEAVIDLGGDVAQGATDGVVWTAGKLADGAEWAGDTIVDGAKAAVDLGGDVVHAVGDTAKWVGGKLNPFNW